MSHSVSEARSALLQILDTAIESARPAPAVLQNLPEPPKGRCIVVGAGKASAAMAAAVDAAWPDVELSGVVSTRYGHAVPAGRIRIIEAGHPVPDQASVQAATEILQALEGLTPNDLVLALISGGGSATLALPIDGLSLEDKQSITRALLASGASINDMNLVRRHLSRIKGGGLSRAAYPARLCTLLISDVPGDDPAAVASGPTIDTEWAPLEALRILDQYDIAIPAAARDYLSNSSHRAAALPPHQCVMIASPSNALHAAAGKARDLGFNPVVLGDCIEGESAALGQLMAGIALSIRSMGEPAKAPAVLISGGETTVSIGPEGAGRGGRNTEFMLSLVLALNGAPDVYALAADSDGIDGTEDAAGAIADPHTLARAADLGLAPQAFLGGHDSYSFFDELGDLIKTGPTRTNVNDIRLVLVTQ